MRLDVWSDVICPWCWLGHVRLNTAIREAGLDDDVELHLRAFQLDPRATREPGDLRSAMETKYGPSAFAAMELRLRSLGAEAGLEFRFDRVLRVSSFDAHRLIQAAQATRPNRSEALLNGLYRAYFAEGRNVADPLVLERLAGKAGLDAAWAREVLSSDEQAARVLDDRSEARELGITGVPAVTYSGAVVLPGAQELDTIGLVLARLHRKELAKASAVDQRER